MKVKIIYFVIDAKTVNAVAVVKHAKIAMDVVIRLI